MNYCWRNDLKRLKLSVLFTHPQIYRHQSLWLTFDVAILLVIVFSRPQNRFLTPQVRHKRSWLEVLLPTIILSIYSPDRHRSPSEWASLQVWSSLTKSEEKREDLQRQLLPDVHFWIRKFHLPKTSKVCRQILRRPNVYWRRSFQDDVVLSLHLVHNNMRNWSSWEEEWWV